MNNKNILVLGTIFTLAFAAFLFWPKDQADSVAMAQEVAASSDAEVIVYKRATCMCCAKWADKMEESGFSVEQVATDDLYTIKEENGVTQELASCHTALVGGYVVEGHVPIAEVERLLEEKPDAIGITVPGMPIGSPGMEVEGREADKYDVLLINKDGSTSVWASY